MIEARCPTCGNINRVAEADVPVGAKFVNCVTCKSRVPLPADAKVGAQTLPRAGVLTPPAPKPKSTTEAIGLADLPMPKRASPLAGEASKPAPRSGLASAVETTGLPAPRGAAPPRAAPQGPKPIELDDFLAPPPEPPPRQSKPAITDLPTPKARAGKSDLSDLPAPKLPVAQTSPAIPPAMPSDLPAPKARAKPVIDFDDPTTPKIKGIVDLPAPKAKPGIGIVDLPGPKAAPTGIVDLPAPKMTSKGNIPPLKPPENLLSTRPTQLDPPRPAGMPPPNTRPTVPSSGELPVPKVGMPDLPTPKLANPDLPAPKGFFDDLPQPAATQPHTGGGPAELPAPKGFFEDLPQPALGGQRQAGLPAPKGFFEDLPGRPNVSRPEVPAPKGFFDDLPGRPNVSRPEVPAPKGFFEDLPGRPNVAKPEVPAPKGFFEDLPGRVNPTTPHPPAPKQAEEGLDLALDDVPPEAAGQFDDLDLSAPTPRPGAVGADGNPIRIRTPSGDVSGRAVVGRSTLPPLGKHADASLELDPTHSPKLARRGHEPQVSKQPYKEPSTGRGRRILLFVVALLAAAGGGGYWYYQRHLAEQERAQQVDEQVQKARKKLAAADWLGAVSAAKQVLELDETQPQALGIGAEANLATALANGTPGAANKAKKLLQAAKDKQVTSPEIERAAALQLIALDQGDRALPKLIALANAAPADPALALYVGWGHTQTGNVPEAIKAFDRAMQSPALKVPALYARGRAKLSQADLDGARADFVAVLEVAKDHIGAQVGLSAARPAAQASEQEADALAILQRKDIDTSDQRAVAQAYVLAAEAARRSNRLDVARERFRKALEKVPNDLAALNGFTEVELRDGKLDAAAELNQRATTESTNNMRAQLLAAEIEIGRKQLDGAAKRLDLLAARTPPPPALDRAHLKLVTGKLLAARGDDAGAVEAYVEASKLAGDLDLAPLLAAVSKLTDLAKAAEDDKAKDKAKQLRERADGLLGSIATNAHKDARLALTLGIAYLQVGAADKAEPWLRQAADARPDDADAHYQLAKALARLGRNDEAVANLRRASEIDSEREEIGIELARTYEASHRDNDADATYTRLLAAKAPSLELRARAGRFYARTEKFEKAAAQGAKILEADRANPAGYYLKAEGLLAAKEVDEARKYFQLAADAEKDPQFLDGLGRAAQELAAKDVKYQDAALRAYIAAAELDPNMLNPRLGMGTLYILRREFDKAVPPLLAAYKIKDTSFGALLLGRAYKELSQAKVAIEWFEHSLKLEPFSATYFNLGIMYFDANQGPKAASALANACRLGFEEEKKNGITVPWLTEALYYLGRVNSDLHNDSGARDAWEKFVARNPPNDARLREARQKLATELRRR